MHIERTTLDELLVNPLGGFSPGPRNAYRLSRAHAPVVVPAWQWRRKLSRPAQEGEQTGLLL